MNTRRPTHAAGKSWRKWQDPLMYGPMLPRESRAAVLVFWLACIDIGGVVALWLIR